ncbi:DUF1501 domain-containing protein [Telmatobacter bradus]|uniref:DUF1501 domain-containing protein n=1 Tax=Telmatobacter bradus TaxID=474953 RepID=UPI003B432FC6
MSDERNKFWMEAMTRRELLRLGMAGGAGMALGDLWVLPALAAPAKSNARAKSVIQIWMWGGPSHLDTFDPKPEAGSDYCGPLNAPIETSVKGMRISELMPNLAQCAGKYSLIRSMTHGVNGHETASYEVQTGRAAGGKDVYPSAGAVASYFKGVNAGYKSLIPPYIVLTEPQGRFSEEGFLGLRYRPFATGGDPARERFAVEGIVLQGVNDQRQQSRRQLLHNLDALDKALGDDPRIAPWRETERQAYDLILGNAGKVFDLTQETAEMRDRYGRNTFGQSCLSARRLVEQGVPWITINYQGGWDTHKGNFPTMHRRLPEMDKALAALLTDLDSRGLLHSTIVWVSGEFGRTPKVQWEAPWNGGRGHWGQVFSALLAGGGFSGGHVIGSSDARGEEVRERPVYPTDLLASIYTQMGIDLHAPLPHPMGERVFVTASKDENVRSAGMLKEIMGA